MSDYRLTAAVACEIAGAAREQLTAQQREEVSDLVDGALRMILAASEGGFFSKRLYIESTLLHDTQEALETLIDLVATELDALGYKTTPGEVGPWEPDTGGRDLRGWIDVSWGDTVAKDPELS